MKIFHLFFGFRMGGAESMIVDLANRQVARGEEVWLVIVNADVDPALVATLDRRVKVLQLGRRPGSLNPWPLLRLNMAVLRQRPHVLHFHNINLPAAVVAPLRRNAVMTLHTNLLPVDKARGARLVAISDQVAAEVAQSHPDMPVTTIYNAVDFDAVSARPAGALTDMPAPGVCDDCRRCRIVQLGRLFADIKGQDLLIEALGILKKRGYCGVKADFIGDGPDRGRLEKLAAECCVADDVRFLGPMSREATYAALGGYDLMVHPSRVEGFGLAIIEGMAAGLPVITADAGAPAEVVGHGRYGRLFAYGDAASLADAIAGDMADYEKALQRADEARRYAAARYSLDTMTDAYAALYAGLGSGR
ncbi:MAG: glycosyltransferase family 4 protein [Muribaculaceae bacterium]|nr:glycosyltransferase family 4 protein [Muribaculaceae bacterium]